MLFCARISLVIGQIVSHYRVLEKLGTGGMGVVYRAEDLRLQRPVALKFLHPGASRDATARERFLREAHWASRLDHPNLCTIFEVDTSEDGQMFIAMACYEGETLAQKLKRGPLELPEVIETAVQILAGLEYAHEARVYHRDIKPSNLMITRRGEVKILDFGIARPAEDTAITQLGVAVGTLPYMSPEQTMGRDVDQRTDLWAVGVLLCEMLTGERPFRGGDTTVRRSILEESPEPITDLATRDLALVRPVIAKALAKDPGQRYQNAREMRDHLLQVRDLVHTGAGRAAPSPLQPSIAVLPFADLSLGRDQEYFCAGLSEELISALARLEGLRVASRTSAFQYKDRAVDVRVIGQQLNVRTVLEGSVRKSGSRLRITAQLTDIEGGYSLWAGRYDREMEDIFEVQEEIAESIVATLRETFSIQMKGAAARSRTGSVESYHAYLRGRYFWNKRTEEDLQKGIRCFEEAIESDPGFAPAYAGLADSYVLLGIYGAAPPSEVMPRGREAAVRALELDRTLAEAHTSLGCISAVYDWNWARARESFQRALELAPAYATAHQWYAMDYLAPLRKFERAASELRIAQELDPLSLPVLCSIAIQRFYQRSYAAAIEQCRQALEVDPEFATARLFLGLSYAQEERPMEAVSELRAAAALEESPEVLAGLGYAYARAGQASQARNILDRLVERSQGRYVSSALIAQVHAGLGDAESTLERLELACEERATELAWLQVRPFFDPLREDPRFVVLLSRLGFESGRTMT